MLYSIEELRINQLEKRLKKCKIFTTIFIIIGFLTCMLAAIEFKVIQDMAYDLATINKIHSSEVNACSELSKAISTGDISISQIKKEKENNVEM